MTVLWQEYKLVVRHDERMQVREGESVSSCLYCLLLLIHLVIILHDPPKPLPLC